MKRPLSTNTLRIMGETAMPYENGQVIEPIAGIDAWIAPSGAFHYVPRCGHEYVANIINGTDDAIGAAYVLERAGWIHLSGGNPMMDVRRHGPTNAQLDAMWSVYLDAKSRATIEARCRASFYGAATFLIDNGMPVSEDYRS